TLKDPWRRRPRPARNGPRTARAAPVTSITACTAGARVARRPLIHWRQVLAATTSPSHERGPHPHRGLSRHVRSDHERARGSRGPRRAAVRAVGGGRGREPGEGAGAGPGPARRPGAEGARRPSERGGPRLRRPARALRPRPRRRGAAARAARGLRLRVRVPAGEHEPAPDPGCRDPVPDPGGGVRIHFILAGAGDFQVGGGRDRVRPPGRGHRAAGRMAAQHSLTRVGERMMKKTMTRLMVLAVVALLASTLAACKKEEAPKVEAKPPMSAPTTDDRQAWVDYLNDVVPRNMGGITNQPYVYFLPAEDTADFQEQYNRLLIKAQTDVGRGIITGNM